MTNSRFSYTVFFSIRRKSWKITPSVRRIMGTCRSAMLLTEKPLIMIRPAVGTSSPVSILIMVDFPEPEGPTKNTNSPSSMAALIPRMATGPVGIFHFHVFQADHQAVSLFDCPHRPVPLWDQVDIISTHSHIIYGFSGHCNASLRILFKVFPPGPRGPGQAARFHI